MSSGFVKSFSTQKGFGFITPDEGGPDIFVHHSAVQSGGFRTLDINARVQFEITQGARGPQAIMVSRA
ncbi:cold-shock protein [Mesoterricola silvestris]|uniref:Cold-shock protein n=1 Tax=Mesoterricola silvestris TaxID=2927979 RepID=A0AA48KA33_9BACT|nr:cold shock domain-containing protein [Mesoterricola silvestris]BDU74599.1 cold-shock protein [Mesoterricola silvestris]